MNELRSLVVEDSPTMRQLLVAALKRIPRMTVIEAENGADAIRKLSAWKFDLIVTDVNMPVMDGLTLIARVRAGTAHKSTPIIVITTAGSADDREKALELGANEYLVKPIQAPVFVGLARKLLKIF